MTNHLLCIAVYASCAIISSAQSSSELIPIVFGKRTGYVDSQYFVAIEPLFEEGHRFSEGYARVRINGKSALIDATGRVFRWYNEDLQGDLHDGLLRFEKGGVFGYIDVNGNVLMDGLSAARDFSERRAAVRIRNRWTYLQEDGTLLASPKFLNASDFHSGFATVRAENGWLGVVDVRGEFVIDPNYSHISDRISEGLFYAWWYRNPNDTNSGYIDAEGNLVLPMLLEGCTGFYKGHAFVGVGRNPRSLRWNMINRAGEVLVNGIDIDKAEGFAEGIAVVTRFIGDTQVQGYMDYAGRMLVEPQFDLALPFANGVGVAYRKNEAVAIIDISGHITWVKDIIARWQNSRK